MFRESVRSILRRTLPTVHYHEFEYIDLVQRIINVGERKKTRNGNTIGLFGQQMTFPLDNRSVPVLTTKKMAWKTCLKELLWFIGGCTDNNILKRQNVNIWNKNASKEFMESRGLNYKISGDLGPIYGHQWRHFNAEYIDCETDYTGQGIDQLDSIISNLRHPEERYSRRLLMSAWNPCQLGQMSLPPCHVLCQFNVGTGDRLSCAVYQRSGDVGLGVPFNIASYAFLNCLIARHCGLNPGSFIHFIGDAHIYEDHIPALEKQIQLEPMHPPQLHINRKKHLDDYTPEDFTLESYKHHPPIRMDMTA